jgi:SsrA-binding protein
MEILNKRASFNYYILNEVEAGIVLSGTEVKSVRRGSVDLKDSYIRIKNNEVYIINMYIAKYIEGNIFNHDEREERKLLLHKKEILKLKESSLVEGNSLIPLKVYFKKNKVKILIGVCKGKKNYDKRESIKERDLKRINSFDKVK